MLLSVGIVLSGGLLALAQDVESGPEKGAKVPALKVFDATGENKDKNVDYAAARKSKPTVYLFINAEKFDRPMNRFMKTLDGAIMKDFEDAYVVAVWVNGDADKVKELFLWAFAHPPTAEQLQAAQGHLGKNAQNKKLAYENILWALLNTKEFVFNE